MRVFVKVCCESGAAGQTYAIPCNDASAYISDLKSKALDRWAETNGKKSGRGKRSPDSFQLRLSGNGALLSEKDVIGDVLQDGEFVDLGKQSPNVIISLEQLIRV